MSSYARRFYYSIPELSIKNKYINVFTYECESFDDLKKKIAKELHISNNCLKIDNPPTIQFKDVKNNFDIKLSICVSTRDIDIYYPVNQKVHIKDCYLKKFPEIFAYIEKEGYYYSPKCIKENLTLNQLDKEIPIDFYPFISSSFNSFYEIKLKSDPVILEYERNKFIFCNNEKSSDAKLLIKNAYPSFSVLIYDSSRKDPYFLKSNEKYQISVSKYVKFVNCEKSNSEVKFFVDFLSTVQDVQKQLANKLIIYKNIKPENLKIYDKDRKEIEISHKPFNSFLKLDESFFYKISESSTEKNRDHEDIKNKTPITKVFYYSIKELSLSLNIISVDINECQTIYDLKKQIASINNVSNDQLQFINPPKEKLKYIEESYDFHLSLIHLQTDANILIPGGKKVNIKDCCKKDFNQIIKYLETDGIYFSPQCIEKNVRLYLSDKEIPREGNHLLSLNKNSKLELKLIGKTVTLNYGENKFILSENEPDNNAKKLVQKIYKSDNILIQDETGKEVKNLISSRKYKIRVELYASFTDNVDYSYKLIYVDLFDTVSDIQKILAKELKLSSKYQPENIIICNFSKIPITTNLYKPLSSFQELKQPFYFKIEDKKKISDVEKDTKPISDIEDKKLNVVKEKKTFKYSINAFFVGSISIDVDINECKTADDFKKKLASIYHVSNDELIFDKPINEKLKNIPEYTKFILIFKSLHPDIDVFIPDGRKFCIKNCYKMKFYEIFEYLQKEKVYFSNSCIYSNVLVCYSGGENELVKFPVISIPKDVSLEIKLKEPAVNLYYDKYQFILSEKQYPYEAKELIRKVFPGFNLSILDSNGDIAKSLISKEKYCVRVELSVTFINIENNHSREYVFIDYIDTVSHVLEKLSKELKPIVEPEKIILYNKDHVQISDINKPLRTFNLNEEFYYRIVDEIKDEKEEKHDEEIASEKSIKIIIAFIDSHEKNFYPLREQIPLDSTINDVINIIKEKRHIKEKININYKHGETYKPIDPEETIEEVQNLIKESGPTGKIKYYMYIDIDSKSKSKEFHHSEAGKIERTSEEEEEFDVNLDKKIKIDFKQIYDKSREKRVESPRKAESYTSSSDDDYKPSPSPKYKDWSPKDKDKTLLIKRTPETIEKEKDKDKKGAPNRRKGSVTRFKPKTSELTKSPEEPATKRLGLYKFEFKGEIKRMKISDDSTLEKEEENIKEEFGIDIEEVISFIFVDESDDDVEEKIKNMNQKMMNFKKGRILINVRSKPKIKNKPKNIKPKITPQIRPAPDSSPKSSKQQQQPKPILKPKPKLKPPQTSKENKETESDSERKGDIEIERGNKTKYFYQVGNEEVEIVELGAEATVQTLKEYIGSKRGLEDVSCMKITFAGKELLNNIKLGPMKIGEMKLFVYIPTMEDILLMTAKALRYDEDDNNEYSVAESDAESKDEDEEEGDD